jgi:hypothetical protein
MLISLKWLFLIVLFNNTTTTARKVGYNSYEFGSPEVDNSATILNTFRIKPTVKTWNSIDTSKHISLISMVVDHHSDASWYLQALHEKYSIGWNRTNSYQFLARPFACNIRFLAVAFESTLTGYETGGTGYLTIGFENLAKKKFWHGFDKNETNRLHCYYTTNKDTGSEFVVCTQLIEIIIQ